MGFVRQEYWHELPFSSPGDLPDREIEPKSLALETEPKSLALDRFFTTEPPGKQNFANYSVKQNIPEILICLGKF